MLIISYDIANNKLRNRFSKFLEKFGFRLQYSVFQIRNSEKVLQNIIREMENKYKKSFTQSDSVVIFQLSETCKIIRYGYAKSQEEELIIID